MAGSDITVSASELSNFADTLEKNLIPIVKQLRDNLNIALGTDVWPSMPETGGPAPQNPPLSQSLQGLNIPAKSGPTANPCLGVFDEALNLSLKYYLRADGHFSSVSALHDTLDALAKAVRDIIKNYSNSDQDVAISATDLDKALQKYNVDNSLATI
jgi:hypothetical protein